MSQKIKTVKEYLETKKDGFYKNWDSTCLLANLPFEKGYLLAKKLEQMAQLMLRCNTNMVEGIEVVTFAIIARAYHSHNYLINSCEHTLNHIISKKSLIGELAIPNFEVDGEAEFCALMVQEISILRL